MRKIYRMCIISNMIEQIKKRKGGNLHRILSNVGWLSANKFLRMGLNIFIIGWTGRYLGPEQFGIYNSTLALVALFGTLASLGLSGIVVRDLVRNPNDKDEILGTAFYLKLFGALLGFILVVGFAAFVQHSEPKTLIYVMIVALGLFFHAFLVIDFWFQSQVQSKYVVVATSISFFITVLLYGVLIVTRQSLIAFVWVSTGEFVLDAIGLTLMFAYSKSNILKWRFTLNRAKELLSQSWLLILSGIGAMINLRIDQVMLQMMKGDREVGIFSAAVRISEVWYFMPVFIAVSVFPALIKLKDSNKAQYQQKLQQLLDIMVWIAVTIAVLGLLFSDILIRLIYGEAYSRAGSILAIHIWAGVFVFMGEILSKWLINENVLEFSPIRHGIGGVLNILINLILIPPFGGVGAAIATVISYATSSYLACFVYPKTRDMAYKMTKALFAPIRWIRIVLTTIK